MIMLNTPSRDQSNRASFDLTISRDQSFKQLRITAVKISVLAVAAAISTGTYAQNVIDNSWLSDDSIKPGVIINEPTVVDGIDIDITTVATQNNFTVSAGANLTVTGNTSIHLWAEELDTGSWDQATHALFTDTPGTIITLKGDVDLQIEYSPKLVDKYGANALYLSRENIQATLGSEGTTTRIWSIAASPDAISVKKGSSLQFVSVNNQVVGTIDMTADIDRVENPNADIPTESRIKGTFSGADSYWFGDEATSENTSVENRKHAKGILDLTFENGAQWSYLAVASDKSIDKRISNITLREGGIINLFDDDLKNYWQSIGLYQLLGDEDEEYNVKHDYVRIGDLKGSGGIFRLDLDGNDKSQSDVVFIENSSDPGMHHFQPHNLHKLESITPENTLIFALVGNGASVEGNRVTFDNIENLHGETLYDYELEIASEKITDQNRSEYFQRAELEKDFLIEEPVAHSESSDVSTEETLLDSQFDIYDEGEVWFIRRVTLHESAATQGMTGSGWASYGAAIEMDRHDRRLAETIRGSEDPDNGLWVRASRGRFGVENQYGWDRAGVTLGFDRAIGENNRLGLWFAYTEGDTELLDVKGEGNMKRYELGLFDTMTFGAHYVDLVLRLGRVSSEFSASNASYGTAGDFDQDYAAVSAEYGYTLKDDASGIFVEPQLQLQGAWLDGYNYSVQRGISADVDSATSLVGRVGLRTGKEFSGSALSGTVYVRGDVMHQITDGQNARFSAEGDADLLKTWGDFETWTQFGFGAALTFKDHAGLQVDLSRIAGGVTEDSWLLSGRLNYRF